MNMINPLKCYFGIEGHVALDRNPGPGYNILLLQLIPGDFNKACPNKQFHTLPNLGLHCRTPTLTHCVPQREAVCTTL